MKILVFEDNLFFVTRLDAALRQAGHEVRLASAAEEANTALKEGPDAAVVSLHAPGALEFVRSASENGIPVAAYCGHAEVELRRQAKEAGAGVLLSNSDLPAALERALRHITGAGGRPAE